MREEDQPPQEIWLTTDALNAHFEWVREKYRSNGTDAESVPDPRDFEQNELTRGMR